ncbi:cellulose binding domain-containing protein [Streptomyces sp. NPDC048109]|uniref:cellulose binding domain-containing protein n=1 Tax=unclassified Streptomyces TaxID=2593676 RepID=UPI0033CAE97F
MTRDIEALPVTATTKAGGGGTPGACSAKWTTNAWNTGFTAEVTLTNTSSTPVPNWKASFTLPAGQSVTSTWNAAVTPSSGSVIARGVDWNKDLAAGGSVSFGFQGTHGGSYSKPSSLTLNGAVCKLS